MAPVPTFAPSRRAPRRAALILVLAWLPGLAFFGHWSELAAPLGILPAPSHSHAASGDHADHCHADVSTCADQGSAPVPVVPPHLALGVAATVALLLSVSGKRLPLGQSWLPLTPPPRTA
ncbi:MAG: hypothetical protein AMXMBFR23_20970 [Chloroflexota bacterium]